MMQQRGAEKSKDKKWQRCLLCCRAPRQLCQESKNERRVMEGALHRTKKRFAWLISHKDHEAVVFEAIHWGRVSGAKPSLLRYILSFLVLRFRSSVVSWVKHQSGSCLQLREPPNNFETFHGFFDSQKKGWTLLLCLILQSVRVQGGSKIWTTENKSWD